MPGAIAAMAEQQQKQLGGRATEDALSVAAVLSAEFQRMHPNAPSRPSGRSLEEFFAAVHALPFQRAALCLSGGGIRSASFALGVLQGLARGGQLGRFHFLSTVSGGGYVGSWLTAWRHHAQNDDHVFRTLGTRLPQAGAGPAASGKNVPDPYAEPPELQGLRQNSNFLTPKLGAASADTWTLAALCGRNLLLNWMIFGPLLIALVLVPQASSLFLGWAHFFPWVHWSTIALAVIALFLAQLVMAANRPLNRGAARLGGGLLPAPFGNRPFDNAACILWVLLPTYVAATCFAIFTVGQAAEREKAAALLAKTVQAQAQAPQPLSLGFDQMAIEILACGAAIGAIIYVAAWIAARLLTPRPQEADNGLSPVLLLAASAVSGAAAGLLVAIGAELYRLNASSQWEWEILAALGVAWVMSSILIADLLFTGLTSYSRNGDIDREFSARACGYLGVAGLAWLIWSGTVLFGPSLLGIGRPDIREPFSDLARFPNQLLALAGTISGFVTVILGFSPKTAADQARKWMERIPLSKLLTLATAAFIFCAAVFLSGLTASTLLYLESHLNMMPPGAKLIFTTAAIVVCFCLGASASYFVNVNRFSLHDIYRNRLIRAFLGSARASAARQGSQTGDPFTGFSPDDNLPMSALHQSLSGASAGRLFHVVNIALNLVESDNLAWQQRKAESFTVTPLHCGNSAVGYRPSKHYGGPRGGLSLGTAMAISGAAASPNQGYHSSPITGFIMMLFNVRLGWWLGNPASTKRIWKRDGPRWSFLPILREMFGRTNNKTDWVYLSDGGHFDNLGIYEMVRRRCRFILVSDAGCDPDCALGDLGNALRKVWIDFGVRAEFDSINIRARQTPPDAKGAYCTLARLFYPEAPQRPGYLIYIKPSYYGTEPADVRAYASGSPQFPHESTVNQWFSESQMESYRALGAYIVEVISADKASGQGDDAAADRDLGGFAPLLKTVRGYLERSHAEAAEADAAAPAEIAPAEPVLSAAARGGGG